MQRCGDSRLPEQGTTWFALKTQRFRQVQLLLLHQLLLLYFHNFYAAAGSLLSVGFELGLQGIPHCFCTDLGEPDVAGKVRGYEAGYQQLDNGVVRWDTLVFFPDS